MDNKIIGERIRSIRGELSQEEFAKVLEVSTSTIGMYETGARVPRDETKIKIANYAKKSVEDIFFRPDVTK